MGIFPHVTCVQNSLLPPGFGPGWHVLLVFCSAASCDISMPCKVWWETLQGVEMSWEAAEQKFVPQNGGNQIPKYLKACKTLCERWRLRYTIQCYWCVWEPLSTLWFLLLFVLEEWQQQNHRGWSSPLWMLLGYSFSEGFLWKALPCFLQLFCEDVFLFCFFNFFSLLLRL